MNRFSIIFFTFALGVSGVIRAQDSAPESNAPAEKDSPWLSDYNEAVIKAEAADKRLMIVFTGTDWIEICQVFYNEILSAPEFIEPASEKFILLKLEFPKENRMAKEHAARNQLLKDAYRVRGYPTVLLTDPTGRPFGLNGYQAVTPAEYAEQILSANEVAEIRFAKLAEAEKLEGIEKAKMITEGIPDLPGNLAARYYRKEMEAVIQIDTEETLEQTAPYRAMLMDVEYSSEMQRLAKDVQWGKMVDLSDAYIRAGKLTGDQLQKVLLNKAGVQQRQENLAGRIQTLLQVIEANPASVYGKEAERQLNELRAQKLEEQLTP